VGRSPFPASPLVDEQLGLGPVRPGDPDGLGGEAPPLRRAERGERLDADRAHVPATRPSTSSTGLGPAPRRKTRSRCAGIRWSRGWHAIT
jgi:hypothetical protein